MQVKFIVGKRKVETERREGKERKNKNMIVRKEESY